MWPASLVESGLGWSRPVLSRLVMSWQARRVESGLVMSRQVEAGWSSRVRSGRVMSWQASQVLLFTFGGFMNIVWKSGASFKADSKVAYKLIESQRKKLGGSIGAGDVVELAKPKSSPIHDDFEWDDTEAAKAYRLEQARYMMRSIVIVNDTDPSHKRRMYDTIIVETVPPSPRPVREYKSLDEIMADPQTRQETLNRLLRELIRLQAKLKCYREFAMVVRAITEVADAIEG